MKRWKRWAWLSAISLALGVLLPFTAARAMIEKGGSHVVYCPKLPAGHWLPCMPSLTGIVTAAGMTLVCAAPVFVFGMIIIFLSDRYEKKHPIRYE